MGEAVVMDEVKGRIEGILRRISMLYGWSPLTVEAYRRDLFSLQDFISGQKKGCTIFDANQAQITAYLIDMQKRQLNQSTIQRQRSAMATWFHYLQNEKMRVDFPLQDMVSVMPALRLPKQISEQDVEDLINAPDTSTAKGVRDRCLLELMYATGMRVSELAQLKQANINRLRKTLRVIGKGNKEREIRRTWVITSSK